MARYVGLLDRWGGAINLTSDRARSRLSDHIADSLSIAPHLPARLDRLIDLGSGQGFPAIPLAIETGVTVDMIEADRRKAAFLTTVLATLGLPGTVSASRIEATVLTPALCVTARALSSLRSLITAAKPFIAADGRCLFLKGPGAASELLDAQRDGAVGRLVETGRASSCLVMLTRLG